MLSFEDNDTMAFAHVLTAGTYDIGGDSHDWFKFTAGPGTLHLSSLQAADSGDVNMVLYNSLGQAIGANWRAGLETLALDASETKDYFLEILTTATATSHYTLTLDLPIKTWTKALDFGPIRDGSIGLYDIDGDGKDEIFVGTSKTLDAAGNEIRPAGLICLKDDGSVLWSVKFPAMSTPDPATGKIYNTTSVTTAPLFTDVDGDGKIDIVVGVGGDVQGQFGATSGQPGDKGGVYAVTATGQIKWFHQNLDFTGNDGRPDGVYGTPVAFDLNADGVNEIIYGGLDRHLYVLDGRTGVAEHSTDLLDTIASSPRVADINNDGVYEILVSADITSNPTFGLSTGGIFHVVSAYAQQNIPGWDQQIGTAVLTALHGRYEPQVLWSSPQTGDLEGDGKLEIVYGTGNLFQDTRGSYVQVWNADGTLKFTLPTHGRTYATTLIADLDGDGRKEIVAATLDGYVQAWNAAGTELFSTHINSYGGAPGSNFAIFASPIAVDLNGDNKLEIIVSAAAGLTILSSTGVQITDPTRPLYLNQSTLGAPAAHDIDHDGRLEIIGAGTNVAHDQAVVFRWDNPYNVTASSYRDGRYEFQGSATNVHDFVDRFYVDILQRHADPTGGNVWTDWLVTGVKSGADVARGFIGSQEFVARNLSNADYVNTLYNAFFNRQADTAGFNGWTTALQSGTSRSVVLDGFVNSQEFNNLAGSFGIRAATSYGTDSGAGNDRLLGTTAADVLRGGAGDDWILGDGTVMPTTRNAANDAHYGQVYRLYGSTLNREPDAAGFKGWVDALDSGQLPLRSEAGGFVGSAEFQSKYGALDNTSFVTLLYNNVLHRAPESAGLTGWLNLLNGGTSRTDVVLGFSESAEYQINTDPAFRTFMREVPLGWNDVIEGGAGNDTLSGGLGADLYIFRASAVGQDHVYQFDYWDELQLSNFGYANAAAAIAHMTQSGADVIFSDKGQTINFHNFALADMQKVKYYVS
jgi:hypothetical protein